MHRNLLTHLCCPKCQGDLILGEGDSRGESIETGTLQCGRCTGRYPILRHVPRFVPESNYADNFGLQWNKFRRTQLDSNSGHPISEERFVQSTGWSPSLLKGKLVLDVGCGAGRFAEIALSFGARLVALDYSSAVDACWENHGASPMLDVVQGNIFSLPFKPGQFDFVYCLGVLQHTPDVRKAFLSLPPQLRESGKLTVDVYPRLLRNIFWSKYWARPFTRGIPPKRLFPIVEKLVETLMPVSRTIGRTYFMGRLLRYLVPVANYESIFPLSPEQLREWALLDTFDMLSPAHDHPQKRETLLSWFQEAGLKNIEVFRRGVFIGRGVK